MLTNGAFRPLCQPRIDARRVERVEARYRPDDVPDPVPLEAHRARRVRSEKVGIVYPHRPRRTPADLRLRGAHRAKERTHRRTVLLHEGIQPVVIVPVEVPAVRQVSERVGADPPLAVRLTFGVEAVYEAMKAAVDAGATLAQAGRGVPAEEGGQKPPPDDAAAAASAVVCLPAPPDVIAVVVDVLLPVAFGRRCGMTPPQEPGDERVETNTRGGARGDEEEHGEGPPGVLAIPVAAYGGARGPPDDARPPPPPAGRIRRGGVIPRRIRSRGSSSSPPARRSALPPSFLPPER